MPYFCAFTRATSIHPFTSPTFPTQLALNPYPFLFNATGLQFLAYIEEPNGRSYKCFYLRGAKVLKLLTLGKSKLVKHFFLNFFPYRRRAFHDLRSVPEAGSQKIPVQPGWYLPPRKIPLAENRFLQAGKGAENTKDKFRQCFTIGPFSKM
jgi:hypothetical protein